jgi:CRISPR system Cascade subunit CasC
VKVPALKSRADLIGMAAATAMFKVAAKKPKQQAKAEGEDAGQSETSGRPVTEYLLFLGNAQIDRVVTRLAEHADQLAGTEEGKLAEVVGGLDLKDLGVQEHPATVALFGRMVANSPDTGVEAGCQVAHAISTHEVATEFDYFTAVDDQQRDDNKGAGMIGSLEFNSATLYRYATVDLRTLYANLDEDLSRTVRSAIGFAKAFVFSMPTGKANTFAHHTRPAVVVLTLREDRPVSHVSAFERPVPAGGDGYLVGSAAALFGHIHDEQTQWGDTPRWTAAVYPTALTEDPTIGKTRVPQQTTWAAALAQAEEQLTVLLEEHQQ